MMGICSQLACTSAIIGVLLALGRSDQMLYLYVDGSDNDAVEAELVAAFNGLVCEWSELGAFLVNQNTYAMRAYLRLILPIGLLG